MKYMALIRKILEQYDANTTTSENMFKDVADVKFAYSNSDVELNTIVFYDSDNNVIKKMKYSVIGLYKRKEKVWVWAWAIPQLSQNEITTSRLILNYGLDIKLDESSDDDELFMYNFLKPELITSRFKVTDSIQLDIHLAVATYISKHKVIFEHKFHDNTSYYLFLDEI
jgi:hypothetical protein